MNHNDENIVYQPHPFFTVRDERKSHWNGLVVILEYAKVCKAARDTENEPAYNLGMTVLEQIHERHSKLANVYRKYWGFLNPRSFYFPTKLPRMVKSPWCGAYTWEWSEPRPAMSRTASPPVPAHEYLDRDGNPRNLDDDFAGWGDSVPTTVIKTAMVREVKRMHIVVPEACVKLASDLMATARKKSASPFIGGAIRALAYWRVPICYQTVASLVQHITKRDSPPSRMTVCKMLKDMGLIESSVITGFCTRTYAWMDAEPYIPKEMRVAHARMGVQM